MNVPYAYLKDQFADPEAILADVRKLLEHGQYTFGPELEQFESRFATLCETQHAVGVGSGTDALFLSLKALGIGPGDEVITAANTFIATAGAIAATGARIIFVDATDDFNIDPTKIEAAITDRTRALLPVHYTGNPADMHAILTIAKKHNLHVVEDACQAIGATINGQPVGSFGIASGFSLHPLKNLNVWGDGGVTVTSSDEIREKLLLLRNHGLKNRDEVTCFGYNSRLDTLQAIVGNHLIRDIDWINNRRIDNAERYNEAFSDLTDLVRTPPKRETDRHVYHLYILQVTDRNDLLTHLNRQGVEAKVHYPLPLHLQEASRNLGYREGDFPVAEAQCKSILSLPVHQHLTDAQIDHAIDTVRKFYK
ncbi:MAG: DegT/DnrJ/EryC1/StrS family aminotransferase [bacterium]|nr:DegT/DnrJ/EryC1/StrS family aminotransferase [bacterium]